MTLNETSHGGTEFHCRGAASAAAGGPAEGPGPGTRSRHRSPPPESPGVPPARPAARTGRLRQRVKLVTRSPGRPTRTLLESRAQ